jgi:hypothetical protein
MKLTSFMVRLVCVLESKNKGIGLLLVSLAVTKLGKHLILSAACGSNVMQRNRCTRFVSNSSRRGKDKRKSMRCVWVLKKTSFKWRVLSCDILLFIRGMSSSGIDKFLNLRTVSVLQVNMLERKSLLWIRIKDMSSSRVWVLLCIASIVSWMISSGSSLLKGERVRRSVRIGSVSGRNSMTEYTRRDWSRAVSKESTSNSLRKSKSRVETESHNGIHLFESMLVATACFVGRKDRMSHRIESGSELILLLSGIRIDEDDNRRFLDDDRSFMDGALLKKLQVSDSISANPNPLLIFYYYCSIFLSGCICLYIRTNKRLLMLKQNSTKSN